MGERRLMTQFALRPVTRDQLATCQRVLEREKSGRLMLMPTHHVNGEGDLSGFCYRCDGSASGVSLPVSRRMFFGHTAAECLDSEAAILALMAKPEANRVTMERFLRSPRGDPALLDCIPDNNDSMTGDGLMQGTGLRTVDCKVWSPELPEIIGIYHAYLRGYTRDVRTHKTFLVCSGGLDKACDEFCNLIVDVGDKWTAGEIAVSEEAWWLRRACSRARCRLLKELADAFGLRVSHVKDIHSHNLQNTAVPWIDTIVHDMTMTGSVAEGTVSIFNECADTTRPFNGILTRMHPGEGYWLFKGAKGGTPFGSTFGDARRCGGFPVTQPPIEKGMGVSVPFGDPCVVYHGDSSKTPRTYQCFDEAYHRKLEQMDWNRDNGHVELMPIIVAASV